jgi:hypothetical protein
MATLLLCGLALLASEQGQVGPATLLLYAPEVAPAAQPDAARLFDRFLQESDSGLSLQLVLEGAAFARLLQAKETHFALVSAGDLADAGAALQPLLVPTAHGAIRQPWLVVDRGVGEPGQLDGVDLAATVRSASPLLGGVALLASLRAAGLRVAGAHVIPVARDLDALLALWAGQVQAAVVRPASLELLARADPAAAATLRALPTALTALHPVFCAVVANTTVEERRAVAHLLLHMRDERSGRLALGRLGFDDFVELVPETLR